MWLSFGHLSLNSHEVTTNIVQSSCDADIAKSTQPSEGCDATHKLATLIGWRSDKLHNTSDWLIAAHTYQNNIKCAAALTSMSKLALIRDVFIGFRIYLGLYGVFAMESRSTRCFRHQSCDTPSLRWSDRTDYSTKHPLALTSSWMKIACCVCSIF